MTDEWGKAVKSESWVSEKTLVLLGLAKKFRGFEGAGIATELAASMIDDLKKALDEMTEDRDRWQVKAEAK